VNEIDTIAAVLKALQPLTYEQRTRVVNYARRFVEDSRWTPALPTAARVSVLDADVALSQELVDALCATEEDSNA
jgi:hypothetical protein